MIVLIICLVMCCCGGAAVGALFVLKCARLPSPPLARALACAPRRRIAIAGKADVGFRTAHACCRKGPFAPKDGAAGASIYVATDSKQTMNAGNQ